MTAISIISRLSRSLLAAGCCWGLMLVFVQSARAIITFPDIEIPSGKQPWELGWKENWGQLETAIIKPLEGFRVTSAAAEAHLAKTRTIFDEGKDGNGWGIIHDMVYYGDNDALLEKLLALGLHPDLENTSKFTWRPSHRCGAYARPKSAKAISLCRPNLSAKNDNHHTVLEAARWPYIWWSWSNTDETRKNRAAVARVWEEVEKNGFPSIAEMASNKQWFAVQNLLRRRIVGRFTEGSAQHQGRTAIEWAVHHGESSLVEELRYYLERYPSDFAVSLDEQDNRTATRFTTVDIKLETLAKELQRELKLAQETSSKDQKTLSDKIKDMQKETEKRLDDVAHNITETIVSRLESGAELSKLPQLLEKTMERQKQLEEQVHTLIKALEDAHAETKAYLYSSYSLLEQSLDNRNNNTAVEVAGSNKSNMAKPAEG